MGFFVCCFHYSVAYDIFFSLKEMFSGDDTTASARDDSGALAVLDEQLMCDFPRMKHHHLYTR